LEDYSHYPGFGIIDLPADFHGETIADREADLVQPFMELFENPKLAGAQLIVAGTAFGNLEAARTIRLSDSYFTLSRLPWTARPLLQSGGAIRCRLAG
jgi:hypothetical protein